IRRCLEKDARRRLKDIGDARLELDDALTATSNGGAGEEAGSRVTARRLRHLWPWALIADLGLGIGATSLLWGRSTSLVPSRQVRRGSMELGTDASLVTSRYGHGFAIILSPDGRTLAFVAQPREGAPIQIYVRSLDGLQAVPLSGTEWAINPFF